MSTRAYLATGADGVRALGATGVLPAGSYQAFFADSDDEEAEYEALQAAARQADGTYAGSLVVAADVDGPTGDVPLGRVAPFHVGPDLSWYAAQELDQLP